MTARRPAPAADFAYTRPPARDVEVGGQLRLDVAEQTGRCRRCKLRPAVVGRWCVACCARAEVQAEVQGDGGQAVSSGNAGAAARPTPPGGR